MGLGGILFAYRRVIALAVLVTIAVTRRPASHGAARSWACKAQAIARKTAVTAESELDQDQQEHDEREQVELVAL